MQLWPSSKREWREDEYDDGRYKRFRKELWITYGREEETTIDHRREEWVYNVDVERRQFLESDEVWVQSEKSRSVVRREQPSESGISETERVIWPTSRWGWLLQQTDSILLSTYSYSMVEETRWSTERSRR